MGPHVRAKFRCLGITQKYDGLFVAELKPVMQGGKNSEENKRFWEYSPNGECQLVFNQTRPIEVGAYYYIDMVQEEESKGTDLWKLNSVTEHDNGGGEIHMSWYATYDYQKPKPEGMLSGQLKIGLDAKARAALEAFGRPGTRWQVAFNFAEKSDS